MKLMDRLYLRFGLFHQTHLSRIFAAFVEGLVIGTILLGLLLAIYGAGKLTWWMIGEYQNARHEVDRATQEARVYQTALLACLNGGVIATNGDEFTACEGAKSFKFQRVQ